jgi:imidazolonepropionase-like amidohydrolase
MFPISRRLLLLALWCAGWPGLAAERLALGCGPAVPREIAASSPVAFVNVNVVPMDAERVLERHTVVVRDGRIAELGPADSVQAPADAECIDAQGRYLMPGLADMHTHFGSDDRDWRNDLFLFVANGVTTVREMWRAPSYLRWRDAIAGGAALGPRLYVASPGMDGPGGVFSALTPPIVSPQQARQAVAVYKALGFDFIKVYTDLTLEVYAAIVEEARAQDIKVVGHIPTRVGRRNVLAAGQYSVEHLFGFPEPAFSTGSMWTGVLDQPRLEELAASIREAGVWITPTLAVGLVLQDQVPAMLRRPEMRYVSPSLKSWFAHPVQRFANRDSSLYETNSKRVVKILNDSGVKLLLGVDSGFRYVLPGFSIQDELRLRVEAGLTPYQALRMATADAAEFLDRPDHAGVVSVGKRGDLILLQANPLDDVSNVSRRVGVMVGGLWLSEERLRERLEEIARSYGN